MGHAFPPHNYSCTSDDITTDGDEDVDDDEDEGDADNDDDDDEGEVGNENNDHDLKMILSLWS